MKILILKNLHSNIFKLILDDMSTDTSVETDLHSNIFKLIPTPFLCTYKAYTEIYILIYLN